ncbi:MAG: cysS [Parachlamydiales bacterium]|nr:cysS [Parachlamydiales bacterium]
MMEKDSTTRLMLFNTESREIESIVARDHLIRMYTCGPTIYDFAHIGNFRTYVFEDLLRRTLEFFGYKVVQAMNITDVDDKTIRGAIAKKGSLLEFTEPFRQAFFEDLQTLSIEKAEYYPAATDYIPEMIRVIERLIEKGCAYVSPNGSIYFKIKSFPTYGRLSHLRQEDLLPNASGDNDADEYDKENISDFVLWKVFDPARDGLICWDSPFGKGRPGWHIECSAMAMKLLGETIDIHCGGVDNMFPHHENEIAQSESFSGQRFVRHWVHVEHLIVDHKKMSKSLNNFYTLRDLLKRGYSGPQVRYLLLSTHYRSQLNFSLQGLDAAKASLGRLEDLILRLKSIQSNRSEESVSGLLLKADTDFKSALAADLNISAALAVLFDLVRELNTLSDANVLSKKDASEALALLEKWNKVLAVLPFQPEEQIPEDLTALLRQREQARKEKNYALSDQLRREIDARGYCLEDTPTGVRLKKK